MKTSLKIITAIIFVLMLNQTTAQLNIPNVQSYNNSVYKLFLKDSNSHYASTHISFKPISDLKYKPSSIYIDEGKYYYWITQKLFKEHFLVFKGSDFWCAVDPVVYLETGKDFSTNNQSLRFWNTRGIRVQAKFFKNFGFETVIYETQANLLNYQMNYVNAHGEYLVTNNGYKQDNAIIPGYARTKPFGSEGYDFAFASGYFSYHPANWLNIQAGNGNHFIGNGHRSILLSDFTVNYPYFKPEILLFDKRLQYSVVYASFQNLYRLPFHLTPEANYEKKLGVSHYAEFSIAKQFQIGFFESHTWVTTDSLGTKPFNYLALNPIIGNSLLKGGGTPGRYNSIFGINLTYSLKSSILYSQLLFDNARIDGIQVGLSSFDVVIPELNVQLEYNMVGKNAYLAINKRANYSHSNLPLAHPLGNNFQEILGIVNYQRQRVFANFTTIYSLRNPSDFHGEHATLLYPTGEVLPYDAVNVWNNTLEIGYRFNQKYNLEAYLGFINRISTQTNTANKTNFAYFGIRTNLTNKTLDW
jgi:hypothetical protein